MKKFLFIIAVLFYTFSYSQNDIFGNFPVKEVTPIKRIDFNNKKENIDNITTKTTNVSASTPTGSSTEVGATEGQLSVSLTGGASYNIPIAVAPGINGIVPQISLSYNSQGGNGLAGYGWNVSGVSVITRIPSTKFHDGTIDAVDFNSMDRFAFDGQRLIVKNGTSGVYGANGTVYETESFSNVQITSYGVHPNGANYGPEYFIVQYPDGSIARYGNSATSRSLTDWAITYWENSQGVRISYDYIISDNNLSINSIKYGSRLTTTPINEISFVYTTRQRPEQAYIGGQSFIRSTILKEIKVKGNNVGFRNYVLTHEATSLGYERLKTITEKSGDNTKSYNPTVFNYEITSNNDLFQISNPITLNVNNINHVTSSNISGDFNGDGNMDFILYPTAGNDAKKKYWLYTDIQGTSTNIATEHSLGTFIEIFPTSWLSGNNKLMPMQGWCAVQFNSITNVTTFNNYSTGTVNPIYFQYSRTYQFPKFGYGYWTQPCDNIGIGMDKTGDPNDPNDPVYHEIISDIPKEFLSGDFNADGLTDVIIIEKPVSISYYTGGCNGYTNTFTQPGGKSYFLDLDRRITTDYINIAGSIQVTSNSKFTVADINGDGKSDLMVFDSGNVKVYSLNNNKQLVQIINYSDAGVLSDKPRYMGDFNGDGKIDFVIPQADFTDSWSFFFSKGNNFQKLTTSIGINYNIPRLLYQYGSDGWPTGLIYLEEINYVSTDYNGDGKSDIIIQTNNTVEGYGYMSNIGYDSTYGNPIDTRLKLLENKGFNGSSISFSGSQTSFNISNIRRSAFPIFLDHNNMNQNLEYAIISGNSIRTFKSSKDNKKDTRLNEIVIGNGVKEIITYSSLNSNCNLPYCNLPFAPSTYTENYPNFDIKQANGFQIVSKIEQVSATQNKQQNFKYFGAVSNLEGLGFLGFRGLARTNWFNEDNPVISSISKHDITKRGVTTETYSLLGEIFGNFTSYTPTDFINKTNMTYVDQLLSNKVYKINNSNTVSTNGLEGTSKEVTTTFDTNNNPLSTTSISKNGTTIERTEIVSIEYFPATTSPTYIIGRLKKKGSSVTHNSDTMTGEEIYTYSSSHQVSKIEKKGHLTNYLTEDNIYDVFGNITQKKITAVGLTPRVTNFTYDTTGRFLLSSTDIEGLISSYTYDTSNGLVLTHTLPSISGFPLITTYLYDVWGKKIKETDYLGKSLNYSYSWLSAGENGFYTTSVLGEVVNSASFMWMDDLGRKIAEGYRTLNDVSSSESNNSWKTYEYDIYDRVKKSYEPQLSVFPQWSGLFSTKTFDTYGRTTQIVEHTGKTSNVAYIYLTTTASDGVSNSTVIKNSLGNIVSMTDNGGTINYQYYANGNLKQSNFGGVVVKVEQDGWGRKTKLIDPSAGTYEYQYNEFGEMKKEITPKGVTNYTIDNFGKITEKTIVGTGGDPTNTKTTYTFNSSTKLLTNTRYDDFTGGFFTLYSYGYDNYKRINFSDESGFNAYYQRATQFDDFGRPEKELYTAINTTDGKRSDKWVRNTYKNGHHSQILDNATSQVLWQTSKVNAKGQFLNGNYGNGINVANTYNQYGFPTEFKHNKTVASSIVDVMTLNTSFESQRGNLISRYNSLFNYNEEFTYDNLDRLTVWTDKSNSVNYNFNTNNEGFLVTNSNVTMTHQLAQTRLYVSSNIMNEGIKKVIYTNLPIGTNIEVKGSLSIRTASLGSVVKISILEKNTLTGQVVEIVKNYTLSLNTFTINHTVSQFNEISIKFSLSNPDPLDVPSISFYLDNITASNVKSYNQTYDSLGRIDENNVGSYNYTNVDSVTSTPKHFQNSSIETNADYESYYLSRANLDITYNAFKSPIDIIEQGKDKLSFIYNMNNSRSSMYYGGQQADKYLRPLRKHYSSDGSMEIKQNITNGTVEFITYIGGDAYSAPVILKSDGTTPQYMYLHRDYLGSILAITNQSGNIIEKRSFDAWGNIAKIQDVVGNTLTALTVIDRGYTGHEHLQGVNLIHMNGRLYDPVVHRFLQPDNYVSDPQNTQAFNRYSYVLNNPLKFSDASGELPVLVVAAIIGAVAGAAGYMAYAIQTGNWSWGGFGMAVVGGAAVGALTGGLGGATATCVTLSAAGSSAASSFVAAFFPAISIPVGDWSFSVSPSIAFGNAAGAGMSLGISYSEGEWNFSGGVGIMSYSNYNGFGANANEIRYSILANWDDGKTGFSLGTNFWRGDFKQRTGMIGFHSGDIKGMYENDGGFGMKGLGDGGDSYRTAALTLGISGSINGKRFENVTVGLNLMTGYRGKDNQKYEDDHMKTGKNWKTGTQDQYGTKFPRGYVNETGTPYRLGALTVGYKGYRVGVNSEHVRHAIQDKAIHGIIGDAGFRNYSWNWSGYSQYKTPNIFTSW